MSNSELKGCPFCGLIPAYTPEADSLLHAGEGWPQQLVHSCKIFETALLVRVPRKIGTKEQLFAKWNTRAQTEAK